MTERNQGPGKLWFHASLFAIVIIVCSLAAWHVMNRADTRLKETHELIISHHERATRTTDSLYRTYFALATDTLGQINTSGIAEFCAQLTHINQKIDNNDNTERVSNLLESELAKIQSEYEVLNLWCALLTVVFLIFSFFSIFKANEMAAQSENALDDMRIIARDFHTKSDKIDADIESTNNKIAALSNSIAEVTNHKDALLNDINAIKDNNLEQLRTQLSEISTRQATVSQVLAEKKSEVDTEYNNKVSAFTTLVEQKKNELDDIIKEMVESEHTSLDSHVTTSIETLQAQYLDLKAQLEDMTGGNDGSYDNAADDHPLVDEEGASDADDDESCSAANGQQS